MLLSGVIEGFYGRPWSWEARRSWVGHLGRTAKHRCYVYAPKSNVYLGQQWRTVWPREQWLPLVDFSEHCRNNAVRFGIGLSPREITLKADDLKALRTKVKELAILKPDIFCLLCDDTEALADTSQSQAILMETVMEELPSTTEILFCPTWYSLDAKLVKLYGAPPLRYYEDLGERLPDSVGVLWTGERVCSQRHSQAHWEAISAQLQRKPVLWDNSVANDGEHIHQYLKVRPFPPQWCSLRTWSAGVLLNPMNQPFVAQLLFAHLAACLSADTPLDTQSCEALWTKAVASMSSAALATHLKQDRELFSELGMDAMDAPLRAEKEHQYRALNEPLADDIADWIGGQYVFDPACLT